MNEVHSSVTASRGKLGLGEMITLVASFGGWLGRKHDGPPGPKAIWTGLQRIRDFAIAVQVMSEMHNLSSG
jgi:hypothetical protein